GHDPRGRTGGKTRPEQGQGADPSCPRPAATANRHWFHEPDRAPSRRGNRQQAPRRSAAGRIAEATSMPRILVIDDDMAIGTVIKTVLEHEGFDVVVAEDGRSGIAAVDSSRFDLIIIDICMPGMD